MSSYRNTATADRRVYVASLVAYVAGHLVVEWVDPCGLHDRVADLLKEWRTQGIRDHGEDWGDEWAIHDHEFGDAWPSSWGEHPPLDEVEELAEVVDDCGESEFAAFMSYWCDSGQTPDELRDAFSECYLGDMTPAEYAEELADDCGELDNVPTLVRFHIDWEGVARDMDLTVSDGFLFDFNRA